MKCANHPNRDAGFIIGRDEDHPEYGSVLPICGNCRTDLAEFDAETAERLIKPL